MQDMNTAKTFVIDSAGPQDTSALGVRIGRELESSSLVVELIGDLGAGKTTFVKGLAQGMKSQSEVASPSFSISREYTLPNNRLMKHYDFYRIDDPGILAAELNESIEDEQTVVVIEWSDVVSNLLPSERIQITLVAADELSRHITITAPSGFTEKIQNP